MGGARIPCAVAATLDVVRHGVQIKLLVRELSVELFDVAAVTEQVVVKRVAALVRLIRQL